MVKISKLLLIGLLLMGTMLIADEKEATWDFAIGLYLGNDTTYCDTTTDNLFAMGDTIDFVGDVMNTTDSTWRGVYVRIWARKVMNDGSAPQNAGTSGTSYSDTFYSPFHMPAYFSMDTPWPTYFTFNLPTDNLREIDGVTPFVFDAYDSLWIYFEDRYGKYSTDMPCPGGITAMGFQSVTICTSFAVDPGTGTFQFSADPIWACWSMPQNPYLMHYHNWAIDDVQEKPSTPKKPTLGQNSPNPFNANTEIFFDLPTASKVTVEVSDVLGKKIATLCDGDRTSGMHSLRWNGQDDEKNDMPSGVYFYKLIVNGNTIDKKKMQLVK